MVLFAEISTQSDVRARYLIAGLDLDACRLRQVEDVAAEVVVGVLIALDNTLVRRGGDLCAALFAGGWEERDGKGREII